MFDRILVVDWSAANKPTTRPEDSIWIADTRGASFLTNCTTRDEATMRIADAIREDERTLITLDFGFGYPVGNDQLPGGGRWDAMWSYIGANLTDDADNGSNRFDVAAKLNRSFSQGGPFWGYPLPHEGRYPGLPRTKPSYVERGLNELRHVDRKAKTGSSVFKLFTAGSVGSQCLTGIGRMEQLRAEFGDRIAIWPFETKFADDIDAPAVIAEIYPSLWPQNYDHSVKDARQVATLAQGFERYLRRNEIAKLMDGPRGDGAARAAALSHEGWIVGFADEALPL